MADDIVLNKCSLIERCIQRIHEEYENDRSNLENYTKQDSIILNIQRACEAAIDLAMHVVAEKQWGIPQTSREAFDILTRQGILEKELSESLKAMVGFRNIAVHNYQTLNLNVVSRIIENHLPDLKSFTKVMLEKY